METHQQSTICNAIESDSRIKVMINVPYKTKGQKMLLNIVLHAYRIKAQDLSGGYDILEEVLNNTDVLSALNKLIAKAGD